MVSRFFIGRSKELGQLESFTLRPSPQAHKPKIAHILGPAGVGKSALLRKFLKNLTIESTPVIHFNAKASAEVGLSEIDFYQQLFQSADTNLGDFQSLLDQFNTLISRADVMPDEDFTGYLANTFLQTTGAFFKDLVIDLSGLVFVFAVDSIEGLPNVLRAGFCSFINTLCDQLNPDFQIVILSTGTDDISNLPEIDALWAASLTGCLFVELEDLSKEEAIQLLQSHEIDTNLAIRIYSEKGGNPGAIMASLDDKELQSINEKESLQRGQNIMLLFNTLQRKWIQWAAIIRICNQEAISMIANHHEVSECMNWILNNYPTYFDRMDGDYELRSEYHHAILVYCQKTEPKLYHQVSAIAQKFHTVKNAIPVKRHRLLLSKLGDLNYFDLSLLKKVFDEGTYNGIVELLESKPVFFRRELDSFRLTPNIHASIQLYNSLIQDPDKNKFLKRVDQLWNEKQKAMSIAQKNAETELHNLEAKNRGLTQSLSKISEEAEKQQIILKNIPHIVVSRKPPSRRFSIITAFLLQATGIGILYINTLVNETVSLSYLLLSGVCIITGVLMGIRTPQQKAEMLTTTAPDRTKETERERIIHHLKLDLLSLSQQKEETINKIERRKLDIINLQKSQTLNYLNDNVAQ